MIDLSQPRRLHIVGIGGAGMSAIATVLAGMGHRVSGTDLRPSAVLDDLSRLGVEVRVGHHARDVEGVDAVAASTAISADNPEIIEAARCGTPVLRRSEILAAIAATRRTIAVAGTHGKTTTSAMLALCLVEAGMQPSFVIGGHVADLGGGARWDDGELFVVEADESDGTFLELGAEHVLVTSIEADHLEYWGSFDGLLAAFDRFLEAASGLRVVAADDATVAGLAVAQDSVTYGTSPDAQYRMAGVEVSRAGSRFTLIQRGTEVGVVSVPVLGRHNAANACGAAAAAIELGVPFAACAAALARFSGVARRAQFRGERDGVTYLDDYAHLPGEVAAILDAVRAGGWRRIVCVFQPHRFSRTAALAPAFAGVFDGVDVLVITDVYAADETPRPGVTGELILRPVLDHQPFRRVAYLPERGDVLAFLRSELRSGDLCLTLGAGDLTSLADELLHD